MGCSAVTGLAGVLSRYERAHWFWRSSTGTLTLSTTGAPAASSLVLFRYSLAPSRGPGPASSPHQAGSGPGSTCLAQSPPLLKDRGVSEAWKRSLTPSLYKQRPLSEPLI
ncbi:hypothetical protein VZT92_016514 [Zoarces viviparus]|uniref:Uncharacterized protein n=1 Tax=Zoarces viviparus TaxID=48416 RepID=A0AAW1EV38_ZOAVI